MTRLVRVELRRLFSRRLTFLAIFAAFVLAGIVVFATAMDAKPLSGVELQQQEQMYQQALKDWKENGPEMVKSCLADQASQQQIDPTADFGCDQMNPTHENFGKPQPNVKELMPLNLQTSAYLLSFIAFLLGAGFVAAEFSTGAIATWLTFEPRRLRVYASKLIAAGVSVIPLAIVVIAIITAGTWVICSVWGSTALTSAQGGDLLLSGLRVVTLTAAAALVGAATGMLLRHTAAVIGAAMAYIVLVEGVFPNLLQNLQPWLVTNNIDAWVANGTTYYAKRCRTQPDGGYSCEGVENHLSFGHGTLYLAITTTLLVLLAGWVFRRRDIN